MDVPSTSENRTAKTKSRYLSCRSKIIVRENKNKLLFSFKLEVMGFS